MHPIDTSVKASPVPARETIPAPTDAAKNRERDGPGGLFLVVARVGRALLAMSCCVVPCALFTLGISGAWIGKLTALGSFEPVAAAVTLGALAAGFVTVYRRPRMACDTDYCARPTARKASKIGLWFATSLITLRRLGPYLPGCSSKHKGKR
jgi:mercuric ion transport protein